MTLPSVRLREEAEFARRAGNEDRWQELLAQARQAEEDEIERIWAITKEMSQ